MCEVTFFASFPRVPMSLLKQVEDKGVTVAWSPLNEARTLLAAGSKEGAGGGFDDYGGELQVFDADFSTPGAGMVPLGGAKTTMKFNCLAWGQTNTPGHGHGLIAGGMGDNSVCVWDPAALIAGAGDGAMVGRVVDAHTAPVTALEFNPHATGSTLLASGGSDAEVKIINLAAPGAPVVMDPAAPGNSKHAADITAVGWNSQVVHILASASANGSCIIWDLRQKKPWCELRDPNRAPVSDIAWNPDEGLHIITASGDDAR